MRKWALVVLTALVAGAAPGHARPQGALCTPAEARGIVRNFVATYNRGDIDHLDRIWAQEPEFFWYTDSADPVRRLPVLSEDRATLPYYFAERAALGDRLHLRKLSIGWERGWHVAWGFSFVLKRTSDQPGATGVYRGMGAVTCARDGERMHAWTMDRVR